MNYHYLNNVTLTSSISSPFFWRFFMYLTRHFACLLVSTFAFLRPVASSEYTRIKSVHTKMYTSFNIRQKWELYHNLQKWKSGSHLFSARIGLQYHKQKNINHPLVNTGLSKSKINTSKSDCKGLHKKAKLASV